MSGRAFERSRRAGQWHCELKKDFEIGQHNGGVGDSEQDEMLESLDIAWHHYASFAASSLAGVGADADAQPVLV